MTEQRFDLPLGPSVNSTFAGKARRYKAPAYKAWITEAGWTLKAHRPHPVRMGAYEVRLLVPENMRGDPDNRIKAVVDLLVRCSVTPDDKHARKISVERSAEALPGRCVVYVRSTARDGAAHANNDPKPVRRTRRSWGPAIRQ